MVIFYSYVSLQGATSCLSKIPLFLSLTSSHLDLAPPFQVLVLVGQPPKQRWQLAGGYPIDGDFLRIGLATLLPRVGDSQQVHQHLQQRGRWQGMARDGMASATTILNMKLGKIAMYEM